MKSLRTAGFALLIMGGISACTTSPDQVSVTPSSDESTKVGYSFGYTLGQTNRELIGDINVDAFVTGFREAFDEADSQLTAEEMQSTLEAYQQKKENEFLEDLKTKAATNLSAGEEFLAENAKKPGITTTTNIFSLAASNRYTMVRQLALAAFPSRLSRCSFCLSNGTCHPH